MRLDSFASIGRTNLAVSHHVLEHAGCGLACKTVACWARPWNEIRYVSQSDFEDYFEKEGGNEMKQSIFKGR